MPSFDDDAKTPQQEGYDFEPELMRMFRGRQVARSGAGLYKLDVTVGRQIVLSAKWTSKRSMRVDDEMLAELDRATSGVAGRGAHSTGLLVVRVEPLNRNVCILDLDDMISLLEEDVRAIAPSKADVRRKVARTPSFLRDDE